MPLSLATADPSVERGQLVLYDPSVPAEVADARQRAHELVRRGFLRLVEEEPGKIELVPPPRADHVHLFRVLSDNGDDHIVWDRRDPDQVREAFRKFREFLAKGYTAYVAGVGGKRGHKIDDFDPGLEQIIMTEKEIVMVPKTVPG